MITEASSIFAEDERQKKFREIDERKANSAAQQHNPSQNATDSPGDVTGMDIDNAADAVESADTIEQSVNEAVEIASLVEPTGERMANSKQHESLF